MPPYYGIHKNIFQKFETIVSIHLNLGAQIERLIERLNTSESQ